MAPKPKGLKASAKRAAPSAAASAGPALNAERTMPLDEDALTVFDLFELRTRVHELLYPHPTSLRCEPLEPGHPDDARNLLRGILHGCDMLEPCLQPDRRTDMPTDKFAALGLGDPAQGAAHLYYLQASALRQLGDLFVDPAALLAASGPSHAAAAAAAAVGGGPAAKRRKVDLREPQTAQEWFDVAESRLEKLAETAPDPEEQDPLFAVLVAAERVHTLAVGSDPERSSAQGPATSFSLLSERLSALFDALARLPTPAPTPAEAEDASDAPSSSPTGLDADDAWSTALRAVAASLAALAPFESRRDWSALFGPTEAAAAAGDEGGKATRDSSALVVPLCAQLEGHLASLTDSLASESDAESVEGADLDPERRLIHFLVNVLRADAQLDQFRIAEAWIEDTYRPDSSFDKDGDDDDEEGEEEEEEEVAPLPKEAEPYVETVRAMGEQAIASLRGTVTLFGSLPPQVAHPSARKDQYSKLIEALLFSSALIDPAAQAELDAIDAEVARLGKEGGIEEEDEAEAEAEEGAEEGAGKEAKE
ncbi:hypothetical protein JCM8202_002715 [Rhodotorula sphaerocarpa]